MKLNQPRKTFQTQIMDSKSWVVIPAAGHGQRMQSILPKQYLRLGEISILEHTLNIFLSDSRIEKIIVAISAQDQWWSTLSISNHSKITTVVGGNNRCDSVFNALQFLQSYAEDQDWILVHDAVRPCLQREDLDKLFLHLNNHPVGGILGMPVRDTLKLVGENGEINNTINRDQLWQALTPQMFRFEKLFAALQAALAAEWMPTDEAAAIEAMGLKPLMIAGRRDNIKITFPEDLLLAEKILLESAAVGS